MKERQETQGKKKHLQRRVLGAREIALEALTAVDSQGAYSNLALNEVLQKYRPEPRESGLATELVYGTIQRRNTIDIVLERHLAKGVHKLQPWVRSLLRLSAYQLLYLDRVPVHAAVSEAVSIAKRRGHAGISGLVNAVLRKLASQPGRPDTPQDLGETAAIAFRESHPEWLIERWVNQFGAERAERIAAANNEPPKASVRANRMRTSRDALVETLRNSGLDAVPSEVTQDGVLVTNGGNLAHSEPFTAGLCTVQDESSMLVAALLDPKPGMRVLDCCAAPGGKTTHIAERMEDRGTVVACDLHPHKRELIEMGARRLKLNSIESIVADAEKLHERFEPASFDRILLDAPCSGFGVIRRKPDIKWTKSPEDVEEIAKVQRAILHSVHTLLKPGGVLVYSTCTMDVQENEQQIASFLAEHPEYQLDASKLDMFPEAVQRSCGDGTGQFLLTPEQFGSDGFYMARLIRS